MRVIEEPATVGLSPALEEVQGIPDARVGLNPGVSEVIERTEDVVVVAGRERELQELRIRDLAGRAASEESALKQVLLASPPGCRDLRRGPDGTLVLEQPLQHADRAVERRAHAPGRFAVPTAVVELLADETAREAFRRAPEVGAKRERASIDARLHLPVEERLERLVAEFLVPEEAGLETSHRGLDRRVGAVDAGRAQEEEREEGRQPDGGAGAVPAAVRPLVGENLGAEPLVRDAGALSGDRRRRGVR